MLSYRFFKKRPNNGESIYGIFQLIEKALSKANKKDFFVLDGGLIKTQYMKYLTGLKPQDIFPNELSDEDSEELLANIIDKNVKKNNVLMAGIDKKILYNNDKLTDEMHAFTIDGFVSKNEIKLRDPLKRINNWEELDNNFIKYGKDKKDLIGININKFKNSAFLLRICPFEDIDYTDKEKKIINYEENYLPEHRKKEIEETNKCKEFLDYLGIDSLLRYKFFRIFENNMEEGIENLLEYFVIFGTRKYQFEYLTNSFLYLLPNDFLLVKEKNMLLEKKKREEEERRRRREEEERRRKEEERRRWREEEEGRRLREEEERRRIREEEERRRIREEEERRRREKEKKRGEGYRYEIRTMLCNKNLDGVYLKSGDQIHLWDVHHGNNQRFRIIENNDGSVTFINGNNAIDVKGGEVWNGNAIQIYERNGTKAQNFFIKDRGNGWISIHSALNERYCIDVSNFGTSNGTKILLWEYKGTNNQKFKLV